MAFSFEYMEIQTKHPAVKDTTPTIQIRNCSKASQASYFFLNKYAMELLNLREDEKVRVGIDKETRKIVIIPTINENGRKVTKNPSGSGSISLTRLIEENNIPTQACTAVYNRNYARGGIILTYII